MLAQKAKSRIEFSAQEHAAEWVEALGLMKEPDGLEKIENDVKYSVKHPYWKPHIDDKALRIMEAQMEVLKAMYALGEEAVDGAANV